MKMAVIAAAVVAALAGTATAASASTPASVTVSASTFAPSTSATYTIVFKTSTTGALTAGTSTITLSGLPFSTAAGDYTVSAQGRHGTVSTATGGGSSVTLTVPTLIGTGAPLTTISASTLVTVTANNTTNPAASTVTVSVATSSDTTAISSDSFTIGIPAALLATGGNNQTVQAGTAFPTHLGAGLKNSSSPAGAMDQPGIPVVFSVIAGSNGSSGNFLGASSATVATGDTGVATAPQLTANGIAGSFTVTATTSGLPAATFTETVSPGPVTSPSPPPSPHGYWLVGGDGGIFNFGSATFEGSTGSLKLTRPVVGITPTASRQGYWLDASDGGVFAFGDAPFEGSIPQLGILPVGYPNPTGARQLAAPIVGMVPSTTGHGYFMVGADGGVFAFGDAKFAGSCPAIGGCSGAAVAVIPDHTGNGYWLVTATGHVYGFGDAAYLGAPGPQGSPVTSAVSTTDGNGYYVLTANGSVYAYGDALNLGGPTSSTGALNPASAIFTTATGGGYWVATANGSVYPFGDAPNDGGMNGHHLNAPIIAGTGF
jgi:hypothetical protein